MTCRWSDILRGKKGARSSVLPGSFSSNSPSKIKPPQKLSQVDNSAACQVHRLEGNGRSEVPGADGESLGRSEWQGAQHRCWVLGPSRPCQGGSWLPPVSCRTSGGCSRFDPKQVAWKYLRSEGGEARNSLVKSTWEKKAFTSSLVF